MRTSVITSSDPPKVMQRWSADLSACDTDKCVDTHTQMQLNKGIKDDLLLDADLPCVFDLEKYARCC